MVDDPVTAPAGDDDALFAAYVGPNWQEFYQARFAARAAGGGSWSWNWAAALVPFWMSFRRMRLAIALYAVNVLLFVWITGWLQHGLGRATAVAVAAAAVLGGMSIAQGGLATAGYHRQARRAVARARHRHAGDPAAVARDLAGRAPRLTPLSVAVHVITSVLVFLLLVVVASLALPHYHDRTLMYRAMMKSDLRNLVTAQEWFFGDSLRYAASLASLQFVPSPDIATAVAFASAEGFHAVATHTADTQYRCEIWVGAVPDRRPGTTEGVPSCHTR